MTRSPILLFAACALATAPITPAVAQTFSPARIRADMTFLGDDLLEGRETGTRGHEIAARYVAARFAALGLTPGAADGWFQPIELVKVVADPARPSNIVIGRRRMADGEHAVIGPAAPRVEGEAAAVFVGYGLDEPTLGLNDYRGLDLKGKVAVAIAGMPAGLPSDIAAALNAAKAEVAANHGAIGLITLASPASLARMPWDRAVAGSRSARMSLAGSAARPDTVRLNAYLDPVATDLLLAGTPLGKGRLAQLLVDRAARPRGFALPTRLSVERSGLGEPARSMNVLGLIPGGDPKLAKEVVVLSAHLDHLGIVDGAGGDRIMNGVLDNAAGVSTMLEVARAFAELGAKPRRSILFVALTAEEKGLLGSDYLARHPLAAGRTIVANVNLDMPILTYDFADVVAYGAEHSTIDQAVERAAAAMGIRRSPDPEPDQNRFTRSDQFSFAKQGIPAVVIKTGWVGVGKARVEDFIARRYHQANDDLTAPIDWQAAAKFARLNFLIARDLADAPDAPRWYSGDFFGDRFARGQAEAPRP